MALRLQPPPRPQRAVGQRPGELYFGHQFATKAAKALPDHTVRHHVDTLAADPEVLRSSFAFYRALDTTIAQNQQRKARRLTLPVLTLAGAENLGEAVGNTMRLAADDVESHVLPGCGHYPAEEVPEAMPAALTAFLAPYRDSSITPQRARRAPDPPRWAPRSRGYDGGRPRRRDA
ncbi:hypothetical protein [Streptomyces melanosporofaciens]|uniref:alpha/beta fold hydrolase n=1 Tax=Streptomyces melanosporofaciens TaxID=67327 RepID=UPI0031389649